ncbi:FxLYD domain-containing protein [Halalkalicoccus jeotgali]|uniref:Uncharacterized protein n=1 Tax=Halalkalicoccus jeotgali (strain DSM 18796 / CECT 7217 / JCM 14584 / KCTC 4019 / B3) TaxID=795797 RepID=D8J7A9_HALJB|nr:FxLYD domain-containing protein [Halalkalicoccus jeotgali]ADJ14004.1 hypothetical protein HacjB3_03055 [Halalkalicoccus jeotgali B3]ELY33950.1 hypothetical protein C497_16252 [Halalkalicoccus jeotgali B3]
MKELDRRALLTTTGATVASIAVAGCIGGSGSSSDGDTNETDWPSEEVSGEIEETPEYLEIPSFNAYSTGDDVGVLGVVENVSDNRLDDIEVTVTLYNDDTVIDAFVDASTEDIDDLRPGNRWQFYVVVGDEAGAEATSFTISAGAEVVEGTGTGNETRMGTGGNETD